MEILNSSIPSLEVIIRIQSPSKTVPFDVAVENRDEVNDLVIVNFRKTYRFFFFRR